MLRKLYGQQLGINAQYLSFLLFKIIFSFYFSAMSEIEMYHPCSLLARQD